MIHLKHYKSYVESLTIDYSISNQDMNESLSVWYNSILNSVGAQEQDIFNTFHLPHDQFKNKLNLEFLSNNTEFINSLSSIGLKKGEMQYSEDYETFLNKPCKFMFIKKIESNDLENPIYILFQSWNDAMDKWEDVKLYTINDNINKFYDKLSSKTIEIIHNGINYIYTTSNGNEWQLQNVNSSNKTFKKYLRKEDLEEISKSNKVKININ